MSGIIDRIQKLKNSFEKLVRILAGEVENLVPPLAYWHVKLKNWHAFGTLERQVERSAQLDMLAPKNEKLARF